jgi:hypothetical protein
MERREIAFVMVYDPKISKNTMETRQFTIRDENDLTVFSTFVLVRFDFFALYIPKMWTLRFHYVKQIIEPSHWTISERVTTTPKGVTVVDLTDDFYQCVYATQEDIDYSVFPECLFYLFQGYSSYMSIKQKQVFRLLLPFLEFLAPNPVEMEHWKKRSQSNATTYLLFSDV